MDLFTAFNSLASNVASAVTNLSEAGISNMPDQHRILKIWSRFNEALLVFLIVLKLIPILLESVKTTISAVWRHTGTFVAAFLAAAVLVALMVYNNGESMEA